MRKNFAILSAVAALGLAGAGGALAGSSNQSSPGTPGDPNCVGQSNAYLAQGAGGLADTHGIGGIASFTGLTVQQVHAAVEAFCTA